MAHHNQINPQYIVVISTGPDRGNVPPRQEGRAMRRDEADAAASYWANKGYTAQVVEAYPR